MWDENMLEILALLSGTSLKSEVKEPKVKIDFDLELDRLGSRLRRIEEKVEEYIIDLENKTKTEKEQIKKEKSKATNMTSVIELREREFRLTKKEESRNFSIRQLYRRNVTIKDVVYEMREMQINKTTFSDKKGQDNNMVSAAKDEASSSASSTGKRKLEEDVTSSAKKVSEGQAPLNAMDIEDDASSSLSHADSTDWDDQAEFKRTEINREMSELETQLSQLKLKMIEFYEAEK